VQGRQLHAQSAKNIALVAAVSRGQTSQCGTMRMGEREVDAAQCTVCAMHRKHRYHGRRCVVADDCLGIRSVGWCRKSNKYNVTKSPLNHPIIITLLMFFLGSLQMFCAVPKCAVSKSCAILTTDLSNGILHSVTKNTNSRAPRTRHRPKAGTYCHKAVK